MNHLKEFVNAYSIIILEQFEFGHKHSTSALESDWTRLSGLLQNTIKWCSIRKHKAKEFNRVWHFGLIYKFIMLKAPLLADFDYLFLSSRTTLKVENSLSKWTVSRQAYHKEACSVHDCLTYILMNSSNSRHPFSILCGWRGQYVQNNTNTRCD